MIIKWNLWDPIFCVVTSNTKAFSFLFLTFSHLLLLLSFHPLQVQCFFLSFFFLSSHLLLVLSFSSLLFSSLHIDAFVDFCLWVFLYFLWVYLFLYQWVLFGLIQRRERWWLDFWVSNLSLLTQVNHHVQLWMFQHHGFVGSDSEISGMRVVFFCGGWVLWVGFLRVGIVGFVAFFGLQWLLVLVGGGVAFLAKVVVVGGGVGFYTYLFGRLSW